MIKNIYIISLFFVLGLILPVKVSAQQQTTIRGVVRDSVTQEPIPYVSMFLKGSQMGVMADENGKFDLTVKVNFLNAVFSSLGYKDKNVFVKKGSDNELIVDMVPSDYRIKEVVIRPKKEKYSKKNNPAVAFVNKLIDRKKQFDPKNHDYYSYEKYEKMTFALNDFSEEQKKKWLFKKFQFIFDYVDTSEVSGKPILTVSIKERIVDDYYRKHPETEKSVVTGVKRAGIDEIFSQESIQQFCNDVFREVDIFGNDVTLLSNRFVSPLSNIGTAFYKYYLLDTIPVNGELCVDLGFVPFNSESFGFTGHIYVPVADTTDYFIKKVKLNVPKDINLNYVENMTIEQDFIRDRNGSRLKTKDDMIVEFKIMPATQGLYVRRLTTYKGFDFNAPEDLTVFNFDGRERTTDDALVKPEAFWVDNRHVPVKQKENSVNRLLSRLREVPAFYYTEKVLGILISGYIETGKDSKFDFGPMNTTISANEAEGARFRVGGLTTANFNPHLFMRGYAAYGTKDGKFKYSGEVEYSFNKKKYHSREFPIHSIKLSHTYDINQLGQHYLYTNKDNVFLSLKRKADNKITYQRKTQLAYLSEFNGGFSYGINLSHEIEQATKWVKFETGNGTYHKDFQQAFAEVTLRYAPNEKFYQTKSNRFPINIDAPIFTLSHKFGFKGILGSDYNLNHTEFGVQKRFWFSAFGYFDAILKAGKEWNKVPYPLLIIPNANLSYTIQPESYPLMNAMEFINDQYVSWDLTYNANGALFNRIPLIKYMKLREVVSFRGLYGSLSKKNNPMNDDSLFRFPNGSNVMDDMPYMEVGVGLDNIFTILRLDYVWRLTYRDTPGVSKSGLRLALHFTF